MASLDHLPVDWGPQHAVVRLPAEIDISNAGLVSDALLAVLNRDVALLVVDLTQTTFCGCAGVTAVLRAQHRACGNGTALRIATQTAAVLRLLAMTGVDRLVPVFPEVRDALAGARADGEQPETAGRGPS